jgi:hypothetical protein
MVVVVTVVIVVVVVMGGHNPQRMGQLSWTTLAGQSAATLLMHVSGSGSPLQLRVVVVTVVSVTVVTVVTVVGAAVVSEQMPQRIGQPELTSAFEQRDFIESVHVSGSGSHFAAAVVVGATVVGAAVVSSTHTPQSTGQLFATVLAVFTLFVSLQS